MRRLLCRVFGHRRWYYVPEGRPLSLWLGCARCKDPDAVVDRIDPVPMPGHPEWLSVDRAALDRFRGWLNGV